MHKLLKGLISKEVQATQQFMGQVLFKGKVVQLFMGKVVSKGLELQLIMGLVLFNKVRQFMG